MKNSKYYFRFCLVMLVSLLFSVALFAQRGWGHQKHHYKNYRQYQRNYVIVSSRPYGVYRPVYSPYRFYKPVYRSPVAYVHFGPVFGFRINALPFGYSRIYVGPNPYYYNEGVYYRSYGNTGYEVVAPPLGATVNKLPANARATVINGQKYYELGGTFYQEEISENNKLSYRVVGTDAVLNTEKNYATDNSNEENEVPALGSRHDELPADCKVQVINQHKYFVSTAGIYYREVIEGDKVRYEVTTVQ